MNSTKKRKYRTYHDHFVSIHGLVFAVSHQIIPLNIDKETERYCTYGVKKDMCIVVIYLLV